MREQPSKGLQKQDDFYITGKLWMEYKGRKLFGPGPAELLERIERTGSINKAAGEMNMSYKKAWEMITILNTVFVKPLVITQSGGERGGGSTITEEAKQLIAYHKIMRERFRSFLEGETQTLYRYFSTGAGLNLLPGI